MQQSNGNDKLNESRESHNCRVDKLLLLGKSKGVTWRHKRRYSSI